MAQPQYDVEQLIENIQRRCMVPTSQLTYEDPDFADLATDELQGEVVPLIMSAREEFFVEYVDVSVNSDRTIPIPKEAAGAKLRGVCYVQQTSPLILVNLPRIDLDVVAGIGFFNAWTMAGFYIQGNDLILYPNTSVPVNTTIRIYYYRRALALAAPDAYGKVISIDENTSSVVLDYVPADWTTGTELNSVSSEPNFAITNSLLTVVSTSSPTVVLDSVEDIEVGDYISEYGWSAIPQVPVEAHAYLAQLTAVKALEGIGDREGMAAAAEKAKSLKDNLLIMITSRVDGSPKKIINPDGGLRFGSGFWRGGYRGF